MVQQCGNFQVTMEQNSDVQYYVKSPAEGHQHKYSLIWIHGLGDTGAGFLDVFTDQDMQVVPPSCKVILPTAPQRKVTCNGGVKMTSWYDIMSLDRQENASLDQIYSNVDQSQIQHSVGIIHNLVKQEAAQLGSAEKVFIGGFSQGCCVALASFLMFDGGQLGGVVGLSGQHSTQIDYEKVDLDIKRKTKMFLYHGTADPLLPVSLTEKTYAEFKDKGLDFTFEKEQGLVHSLSQAEITKFTAFFHSLMQ